MLKSYREVLREKISPTLFFVFNVLFISLAQSILLFAITAPTYALLLVESLRAPLTTVDSVFPRILLGLVLLEWFADQQQWGMSCHAFFS
jgi:steroid 5-alpha reductase family enzyme